MTTSVWTDRADEATDIDEAARFAECSRLDIGHAICAGELGDSRGILRRRDVAAWIESQRLARGVPSAKGLPEGLLADILTNGFGTIPAAVTSEQLVSLRASANRLIAQPRLQPPANRVERHTSHGLVLERIRNVGNTDTMLTPLVDHPLLSALGDALLGEHVVYQVSLVVKLPRVGVAIPAHRDPTWTTRSLALPVITVGFYLDNTDSDNGGPWFCPGTHLVQCGRAPDVETAAPRVSLRVDAGTAVIHNLGVVHGSEHNPTASLRRTIYCSLMSVAEACASRRDVRVRPGIA